MKTAPAAELLERGCPVEVLILWHPGQQASIVVGIRAMTKVRVEAKAIRSMD